MDSQSLRKLIKSLSEKEVQLNPQQGLSAKTIQNVTGNPNFIPGKSANKGRKLAIVL